ncbi:oligopeptide transport ATP-binding protein OppD [Geomicrobium sp. JCM 19037]|uniref:ABC transporter ATP-binding protein n=1 Tax=unclassified Geomicrobium TaxID=2628951 RepID=UPI00045F3921|nr:ABC transporter ATP-binding protein [Geomicrobium sp. JCM 19037]GAK04805.1 oligopeptide transport ATP-binding protein OppD [Geomicrobium sp. JCM 19037]
MADDVLLEVNQLKTYFYMGGNVAKAVDGIDFSIKKGKTLAIVGESGSGKSMTSLSIMQLVPGPTGKIVDGAVKLSGKDLLQLSDKQMEKVRGNEIGMVFQEPMTSLNPVFTVGTQIKEPLMKHRGLSKSQAFQKGVELLKLVGFPRAEDTMKEFPHQLSGGMRQRVMIAIAMSCDPKLLIADEPTTALDVTIQAQILDLMKKVQKEFDSSILLITHDLGVVAEMADDIIVMYGGQVVEQATRRQLLKTPKHPYTVGLLESMPSLTSNKERLTSIRGSVPPAHSFPEGCRFAPRCDFATENCTKDIPELVNNENEHLVRCILYAEQGGQRYDDVTTSQRA